MATTKQCWLVFRMGDQSLRVLTGKRAPALNWDEIAWQVKLKVPEPWGRVQGDVEITLPDSPPPEIVITEIAVPAS